MHYWNVLFEIVEAGGRLLDWINLLICDHSLKLLAELLGIHKTQTELYVTVLIGADSPLSSTMKGARNVIRVTDRYTELVRAIETGKTAIIHVESLFH